MTVSNRAKAIIALVLVLIAVILIIIFLPRPEAVPVAEPTPSTSSGPAAEETPTTTPTPAPTITPERQQEVSATTVGKIFAERYGSYSSESDLTNIEDVLPLTTDRYRAELENFIEETRSGSASTTYYGVSTRVLTTTASNMTETTGTLTILTQREESKGSVQNEFVRNQTIVLEMKMEGEAWKVDSAVWQ